ncbi:amino acid deaminase/aldolase [Dactylosporangium sp. NPDC005572]|uniref:amino acid deaminase/aldolase n=1 Tax=Dactylosporangium sp. NPDC005572 TaxID=3156889 RepID=UPI0033B08DA5
MSSSRAAQRARYDRATADLDPPFAIVDLDAFDANSAALVGRAAGKPLRVPSKSVRVRALIERALGQPGWRGIMAFTLPEAIWLAGSGHDDVLVAYPTADRGALRRLAGDEKLAASVTVMVDNTAQLDFVDAVVPADRRAAPVRVCIDLDASWRPARGVHIGVRRSPVHSARQAGELAAAIAARPGFRLVGVMSYEAQIAGLGDAPPGRPVRGALIRLIQSRSFPELVARRGAVVAAVREHADLEFVNGGGTGSVAATAGDPAVTEVAAGSGLFGPWLFDGYRRWRPQPAAFFALTVVRRPDPRHATALGGGWIASGETSPTRQPLPWLPEGLELIGTEGAGEVQTPLTGPGAAGLRVGDRVYFRHSKAGELCEHVNEVHLISGDTIVDVVPTYRGEGRVFL